MNVIISSCPSHSRAMAPLRHSCSMPWSTRQAISSSLSNRSTSSKKSSRRKKTPSRRMQSKILGETKSTDQSSLSRILRPGMAGPSLRRRKSIASGDSLGKVRADTDILPRLRDPQNRALRKDSSTVPRTYSLDGRRLSSHHPRRLQSPSLFRWQPKSDG